MKIYKINKEYNISCEHQNTRNGFRHVAILFKNGEEVERTKACYLNRTWESYEFESVIKALLNKTNLLSQRQKNIFLAKNRKRVTRETSDMFKTVGMIASLGEIFYDEKKEQNDWKLRMIKAGLKGLSIPEDWDTLNEEEKEARLNKIIEYTKVEVEG